MSPTPLSIILAPQGVNARECFCLHLLPTPIHQSFSTPLKRATFSGYEIVFTVRFLIGYRRTCYASCRKATATKITQSITNQSLTSFDFTNVPIFVNGTIRIAPRITFVTFLFLTEIGKSNHSRIY